MGRKETWRDVKKSGHLQRLGQVCGETRGGGASWHACCLTGCVPSIMRISDAYPFSKDWFSTK